MFCSKKIFYLNIIIKSLLNSIMFHKTFLNNNNNELQKFYNCTISQHYFATMQYNYSNEIEHI